MHASWLAVRPGLVEAAATREDAGTARSYADTMWLARAAVDRGDGGGALPQHPYEHAASDEALLALVGVGDREALAALYARHRGPLYGYLARLAPDRSTAEEILQDVLLAVWRGAGSFEGRASVRGWLFGIARRQAHDRLRRRAWDLVPLDAIAPVADGDPTPEDAALRRAAQRDVQAALARLAPAHRDALVLFFVDDFSHAEMADILGVPVGTVKSRLSNAKRALAALLADSGEDHDG